jgi:ribonucrease Y
VLVDAAQVDDGRAMLLAREIAKRIETELTFPGEIRVTVLRETRVTEYAR